MCLKPRLGCCWPGEKWWEGTTGLGCETPSSWLSCSHQRQAVTLWRAISRRHGIHNVIYRLNASAVHTRNSQYFFFLRSGQKELKEAGTRNLLLFYLTEDMLLSSKKMRSRKIKQHSKADGRGHRFLLGMRLVYGSIHGSHCLPIITPEPSRQPHAGPAGQEATRILSKHTAFIIHS